MNSGCTHRGPLVKLVKRAERVQFPCHGV